MCRSTVKTTSWAVSFSHDRIQLDSNLDGATRLLRSRQQWEYAVSAAGAEAARKSTTQSHRAPVFYVDLCLRDGISLDEAVAQAKLSAAQQEDAGVNIAALELAARMALANGAFEDGEEEVPAIVDEFYRGDKRLVNERSHEAMASQATADVGSVPSKLSDRLGSKVGREAMG